MRTDTAAHLPSEARRVGPLPEPFGRLVGQHVLTSEQARAVLDALELEGRKTVPPPEVHPPAQGWVSRLAEVGGYLGAALLVAAGALLVGQQWADMSYAWQVAVPAVATIVLAAAASFLVIMRRGMPWSDVPNGDTLRRLSGTLFTLAGAGAFGTMLVVLLGNQDVVTDSEVGRALLLGGAVAFAVVLVGLARARTSLGELAVFGTVLVTYAGAMVLVAPDSVAWVQWTLLPLALGWALLATYTHLMVNRTLMTAAGLAVALFAASVMGDVVWSQRLALVTLLAVSLAVYLTRPTWPYITAAILAAVVLTVQWVGQTMGAAVALLAAGVVLLVLAGGALLFQRHRHEPAPLA